MRDDDIAALKDRCAQTLSWAHHCFEEGQYVKCVQESYFAAFYAAKAALIHLRVRSKSHRSVQDRIDGLAREGRVQPGMEDVLKRLLNNRNEAAYRFARAEWTAEEASTALQTADRFIGEMRKVLDGPPG